MQPGSNVDPIGGSEQCVFCAISAGRTRASIVHEDAFTLTFLDVRQFHPGRYSDAAPMNQWSMIVRFRKLLPALAALFPACTDSGCIDICSIWSDLEGTVATSAGAPVSNADVELRLMYIDPAVGGEVTCQSPADELDLTTTDATGAFFASLHALSIGPPDCVEVTVNPPEESGLSPVVATVFIDWSQNERSPPVRHVHLVLPD